MVIRVGDGGVAWIGGITVPTEGSVGGNAAVNSPPTLVREVGSGNCVGARTVDVIVPVTVAVRVPVTVCVCASVWVTDDALCKLQALASNAIHTSANKILALFIVVLHPRASAISPPRFITKYIISVHPKISNRL